MTAPSLGNAKDPNSSQPVSPDASLDSVLADFHSLDSEFIKFEELHKTYLQQMEQEYSSQAKCLKELSHHKYRLDQLSEALKSASVSNRSEDAVKASHLRDAINSRKAQLGDIAQTLPRKANIYLRTILGNVNLALFSQSERFKYKDEYERFKLIVTIISTFLSFCNLFLFRYRFMDAAYHFLLVWYYCTLTIREGILRLNGSKIQGWWVAHHYITCFLTGILVTWPDTVIYHLFRNQFYVFSLYLGLVQVLQFRYQHGQLYKLKALGERSSMELTVDGFHSWMWRGLGFLLPFLFGGYIFQLYNGYVLWQLSKDPRCIEWQVLTCAIIFFILSLGNIITTLIVVKNKLQRTHIPSTIKSDRLNTKDKSS